jgi:hypothetical protein
MSADFRRRSIDASQSQKRRQQNSFLAQDSYRQRSVRVVEFFTARTKRFNAAPFDAWNGPGQRSAKQLPLGGFHLAPRSVTAPTAMLPEIDQMVAAAWRNAGLELGSTRTGGEDK